MRLLAGIAAALLINIATTSCVSRPGPASAPAAPTTSTVQTPAAPTAATEPAPSTPAATTAPAIVPARPTVRRHDIYYISPTGSDWSNGRSPAAPLRSFARAFAKMDPGDELILLDGEYSTNAGTGTIHHQGNNSAQPPSGKSPSVVTTIRAQHPGKVKIAGELFLGRSFRKDSYIRVQGITFVGGGVLYNTSHVTIKECGFNGGFGIGTNDHHHGNSDNLIEDVWIWAAKQRIIAINYRSHHNVWRRVLVRGDGCGLSNCRGGGNPNVGVTVYDSSNVSFQNVMVVDRLLAPGDSGYADFAIAQHTPDPRYYFGKNEWLGTISLNAPDHGYYMEPDHGQILDPTIKISNAIAWNSKYIGFNFDRDSAYTLLENITVLSGADGIRVGPNLAGKPGQLRNILIAGAGRYGVNSAYPSSHVVVYGADTAYNRKQAGCTSACYTNNPRQDGATASLRYLPRIEPGSFLKGRGTNGADIGANVVYRYGRDDSRFGEPGYNALTQEPLWPWPNEPRIQMEMCAEVTRGFCSAPSLTHYIWSQLGTKPGPDQIGKHSPASGR